MLCFGGGLYVRYGVCVGGGAWGVRGMGVWGVGVGHGVCGVGVGYGVCGAWGMGCAGHRVWGVRGGMGYGV